MSFLRMSMCIGEVGEEKETGIVKFCFHVRFT